MAPSTLGPNGQIDAKVSNAVLSSLVEYLRGKVWNNLMELRIFVGFVTVQRFPRESVAFVLADLEMWAWIKTSDQPQYTTAVHVIT